MFGLRKRVEEIRRTFERLLVDESRSRAAEDRALGNRIRSAYDVIDSVNDRVDDLKANLDERQAFADRRIDYAQSAIEAHRRDINALIAGARPWVKENALLREQMLELAQRSLNPIIISVPKGNTLPTFEPGKVVPVTTLPPPSFDDQVRQQLLAYYKRRESEKQAAPAVYPSRVHEQPKGERFEYGATVRNTVTHAAYLRALDTPKQELISRLYNASYGIVVPRPHGMPEFSPLSGLRYVWVLCDDGKVRGAVPGNLRAV